MTSRMAWTPEDDEMLVLAYKEGGRQIPAALLSRHPLGSCRTRAKRMDLTDPKQPRHFAEPFELAPLDAAYLAGLIDGEGYVSVTPQVRIAVTGTDAELAHWIDERVPVMRIRWRPEITTGGKQAWDCYVTSKLGCAALAVHVLPFMVCERKRERMALLAKMTALGYTNAD